MKKILWVVAITNLIAMGISNGQSNQAEFKDQILNLASEINKKGVGWSIGSIAENYRSIQQWDSFSPVSVFIESNPRRAAEIVRGLGTEPVAFSGIVGSWSVSPESFLLFWSELSSGVVKSEFIEYGILPVDGDNRYTLALNRDLEEVQELLLRLSNQAGGNQNAFEKIQAISDGTIEKALERQLEREKGEGWREAIPEVRVLDAEESKTGESLAGQSASDTSNEAPPSVEREQSPSFPTWALVVIAVAAVGILFLLIQAFLRGRAS